MAALDIRVEIGADFVEDSPLYFRLDDPVKGLLDNTGFRLGGTFFYDITERVTGITTRRGKNEALDRTDAGIASVTLRNNDRQFDPLFEDSLFFGFLVPRRNLRITANGRPVYIGFIEDVDLDYRPGNISVCRIDLADGFSKFATARLPELTPPSELPGARINRILDLPEVAWPEDLRTIDTGTPLLLDADIQENTVALDYLQRVNDSELGNLFIGKDGTLIFRERDSLPSVPAVRFTDSTSPSLATDIGFSVINNVFGSENLFTRIVISNDDVIPEEVIVEDTLNAGLFGVRTFAANNLLIQELADLEELADLLLERFKEPKFRFESVGVSFDKLTEAEQNDVLDLEVGDIVEVEFTPSGIPPAIQLPCRIIGIQHDWRTTAKTSTFSLETLPPGLFILDSLVFGILDSSRVG